MIKIKLFHRVTIDREVETCCEDLHEAYRFSNCFGLMEDGNQSNCRFVIRGLDRNIQMRSCPFCGNRFTFEVIHVGTTGEYGVPTTVNPEVKE